MNLKTQSNISFGKGCIQARRKFYKNNQDSPKLKSKKKGLKIIDETNQAESEKISKKKVDLNANHQPKPTFLSENSPLFVEYKV